MVVPIKMSCQGKNENKTVSTAARDFRVYLAYMLSINMIFVNTSMNCAISIDSALCYTAPAAILPVQINKPWVKGPGPIFRKAARIGPSNPRDIDIKTAGVVEGTR
jgi:hypothetical protein